MALLTDRTGILASAQGGTGASANTLNMDEWNAVAVFVDLAPGGSTVQLEQSLDGGTTWRAPIFALNMLSGTVVTTAGTAIALFRIDNPAGLYRSNVTAFVGAATVRYKIAAAYQE